MVGVILESIEGRDDVLFVLSSDHGGDATGNHGSAVDEHLLIPIFIRGRGVKVGHEIEGLVRDRDITPTVVWAMGIEGSPHWYGDVLYDVFEETE